jgi:hypothetical protein
MANPGFMLAANRRGQPHQLHQRLTSWSGFVASWLDQRDIPVHLLRYEDLSAAPATAFAEALAFAGCRTDPNAVARAVSRSTIDALQQQEAALGFREAPRTAGSFFRRGIAGGWRDELTADQVARIEVAHAPMMARLGYAPSAATRQQRMGGASR